VPVAFTPTGVGHVDAKKAQFMADSQNPISLGSFSGAITEPAWKTKPSWYLLATDDKMIHPDTQRSMSKRAGSTVVEVKGSHAIYVSQPEAVARIIEEAAKGAKAAAK
jgi:pimeloyl-ACP methyl ester carboxylesterase